MANDTVLNPGLAGDTIRDIEKAGGAKTQVVILDYGGDGTEDIAPRPYGAGATTSATPRVVLASTALTPSAPSAAAVGVASAEVVAANASRKGLSLVNTSTARISLGFGAAAVLDSGVTLYPGGVFDMDQFSFTVGAVNGIASAALSNLAIQEYA